MAGCHEVRVRWTVLESTKEGGRGSHSRMSLTQLDKFSVRGPVIVGASAASLTDERALNLLKETLVSTS